MRPSFSRRLLLLVVFNFFLLLACRAPQAPDAGTASPPPPVGATAGADADLDRLSGVLGDLMAKGGVPGAAFALVRDGAVVGVRGLGLADVEAGTPVTADTVFEAASLSKPVFAWTVMKLRQRGDLDLDLDRPLSEYLAYDDLRDDPRAGRITARMVLAHTTGLPNWRPGRWSDDPSPLATRSEPGAEFGYSGEGYVYLQRVVEHLTGASLEELAAREVFEPLGMASSTYAWSKDDPRPWARPHDFLGEVQEKRDSEPLAAGSLHTTAGDYARFVAEVVRPRRVGAQVIEEMLTSQVEVADGVSWGLGWGLEESASGPVLWHWGDNGDYRCLVMASAASGDALVLFTDSNNGLAIAEPLVEEVFGAGHPAFGWMGYDRYDAPGFEIRRRLVAAGLEEGTVGVAAAIAELSERYSGEDLAERLINGIGYDLLRRERVEPAVAVFEWNVELYPESWNVYDSLGEAYAEQGETVLAIESYEKSLELDPENDNAVAMLERLRGAGS